METTTSHEQAGSSADEKPLLSDKDYYEETRDILRYESELINRRLTWLVTSQSLIFAAIGATSVVPSTNDEAFKMMFVVGSTMGFVISIGILFGICAAIAESHSIYREFEERAKNRWRLNNTRLQLRRHRKYTMFFGVFTGILLPFAFMNAWAFVIVRYSFGLQPKLWWHPGVFGALVLVPILAGLTTTRLLTNGMFGANKER